MNQRQISRTHHRHAGFTLVEILLAMALMGMLATLLSSVLGSCRRSATAAEIVSDRMRKEIALRELIQSDLDRARSPTTLENDGTTVNGFSFTTYATYMERYLLVRVRYIFEFDHESGFYRLQRYVIPEGIGVRETGETVLEGLQKPALESYSDAAEEFLDAGKTPGPVLTLRLRFTLMRSSGTRMSTARPPVDGESTGASDDIWMVLRNEYR